MIGITDTRPSEMIAFLNGRSAASSKVGIGAFLSISSQLLTMPFMRIEGSKELKALVKNKLKRFSDDEYDSICYILTAKGEI